MKAKLPRLLVLAAAALVLLGVVFAFLSVSKPHRKNHSPEELAFWVELHGEVQVRKPNTDEFIDVKPDASILSTSMARTGPQARAIFEVLGGEQFELSEDARVLFEKQKNEKTRISMLAGRIRYKGNGDLAYVEIARQGRLVSTAEVKGSEISAGQQTLSNGELANLVVPTQTEASDETETDQTDAGADADSRATISQDEILNVLSVRLGQFKKCYLTLIQRAANENTKAHVLISFMIQPNGNVDDARVWRSNINDRLFLGCLAEVVSRTRFKPFKGDPIRIDEFPLDFE